MLEYMLFFGLGWLSTHLVVRGIRRLGFAGCALLLFTFGGFAVAGANNNGSSAGPIILLVVCVASPILAVRMLRRRA
jgi:hypothetical protein